MHPRRWAWLAAKAGAELQGWPGTVVTSNAIPTTNGASTNQDTVVAMDPDQTVLYVREPEILVMSDVLSNTGQVRIQTRMYAALLAHRAPYSIGVLSGTGLATPAWP
jgi:hypothetical protein